MAKKELQKVNLSWGNAYVSSSETPNTINGRLFEVIEALGLTEKQEDSIKSIIRKTVWECFENSVYISSKRHDEIRKDWLKIKSEAAASCAPVPEI